MSRAINLAMPEAEVVAWCQSSGVAISAIEPLPSGGTHVVCKTGEGADEVRLVLDRHVILTPERRFAFYRAPQSHQPVFHLGARS